MMFEHLQQSGTRADRVLIYPTEYSSAGMATSWQQIMLQKARDEYDVILKPVDLISREGGGERLFIFLLLSCNPSYSKFDI
jgi:hypothetical protein